MKTGLEQSCQSVQTKLAQLQTQVQEQLKSSTEAAIFLVMENYVSKPMNARAEAFVNASKVLTLKHERLTLKNQSANKRLQHLVMQCILASQGIELFPGGFIHLDSYLGGGQEWHIGVSPYVQQYASKLLSQADRYGNPVSLIHFDIDHFRRINSEYSQASGDQSLSSIAHLIKGDIRDADILARIGGDEFVIILPKTCAEDAKQLVERLKQDINSYTVELSSGPLKISARFGLSSCDSSDMKSIEGLIQAAQG